MKNFSIIEYLCGRRSKIYTIQFEEEINSEFYKFIESFYSSHKKIIQRIVSKIKIIADKTGAENIFFDIEEGKLNDSLCRFKGTGDLRLYCLKYGKSIIILGSGGIKSTRTYQMDDNLNVKVIELQKIDKLIYERIKNHEIQIDDFLGMLGNLNFNLED